jgi:hypothetical protein
LSVFLSFGPSLRPQKNLVETRYEARRQPSFLSALPMICSEAPLAYTSALSKKFTPAAYAAAMQSRAWSSPSWLP